MAVSGAQYIIKALEDSGVDTIFGYPGGAIMPIYDALVDSKLKHILCRHEQGAALAADGYSRSHPSKVGVCMATSGPGATNLVTGIANAYMDSIPMVAITGQVATHLIGTDAFQEVDIYGITLPIVKHSYLVRDANDLPRIMKEAFAVARSGRPGPVLIDIPKDIQVGEFEPVEYELPASSKEPADMAFIEKAIEMMQAAERPLIYSGGGVGLSNSHHIFKQFAEKVQIPVVTTLKGIGNVSCHHELYLGMLGMHGTKASNFAVSACDLLICIGARFDDRATGNLATFASKAKVIQLDCDAAEHNKLRQVELSATSDMAETLTAWTEAASAHQASAWKEQCLADKKEHAWQYDAPIKGIYAPKLINDLSQMTDENTYISCDVGQHQMWVAQHYEFDQPRQHLTSGGLGTMGYGLPAAIGAQLAQADATSIVISGDGSIMMNIQELATLKRYNIPVKVIVLDNQRLGMVKQWQELFFDERFSEVDLSDNPEFTHVAKAFGIHALSISKPEEVQQALQELINHPGPMLLHVHIDPTENVWPLVPPGASNQDMIDNRSNP